ncbi:aldo/keto reductase [Halorarum halophilum]|uniref:Aldo/keto reductase n=1 Tax=Halorarum halophilum TaxID=2743090 RepID=A0A7D5GLM1_9EURY|nr:aldo/keto reductase [Halobaculum halophilum]QLG28127.1 aldo/keto reductase [Halobaculum halophilum]
MDCAFVGAGAVAREYAAGLPDSPLRLTAVCDLDLDRATALADEHGAAAYADLGTMLEAEPAPLLVNLTSHEAHAGVTRTALQADRHVFSQKPLAMDADAAAELVALAEDRALALGCAPTTPGNPAQRRVAAALADGRLGPVRLAYAHAHVGRVTEWHDDPTSFLRVGPLYDGAVYPLTLLVAWFGPMERVRSADAVSPWPEREERRPERPSHVEATLAFADGPTVRLTASLYAPHRSREFNSLELHGDDGSLYLADCGAMADGRDLVRFARSGHEYTSMPPGYPAEEGSFLAGPERLAAGIERGRPSVRTGRRAAHVVATCAAIETLATENAPAERVAEGEPSVRIDDAGTEAEPRYAPDFRPTSTGVPDAAIRLPRVGFGCARYRDGEYVERADSIAAALDAGYRLLDSAELYGNEQRIGEILAAPGTPRRSALHLTSKVWNTNHEHVAEACGTTLAALGVGTLDSYLLHWPDAWEYQGPLTDLASLPADEQERLTFPRDEDGDVREGDVTLAETWRSMERLVDRGLTRAIGICNVPLDRLERLVGTARIPPAIVQVEHHPREPREALRSFCHDRGIRLLAHTPLDSGDLLDDDAVRAVADDAGVTPAQAVLAWSIRRGVVPIPSSIDRDHLVDNLAAGGLDLDPDLLARLDALGTSAEEGDEP